MGIPTETTLNMVSSRMGMTGDDVLGLELVSPSQDLTIIHLP